jgi:hypothetical protein
MVEATKVLPNLKTLRLDRANGFDWRTTSVKKNLKKECRKTQRRAFHDKDGNVKCLNTSLKIFDSCYFFDANTLPVAFPSLKGTTIPCEIFQRKFVYADKPFRFDKPAPNLTRISTPISDSTALPLLAKWCGLSPNSISHIQHKKC